uniref:Uncharacterized protein n=1 Tax=Arundo donax TaxID=35708 RepID=A0A0A9BWN3_ARUDO
MLTFITSRNGSNIIHCLKYTLAVHIGGSQQKEKQHT